MSRNTAKSWCRKSQAFPGITCAHCLLCQRKLLELTLKEVRRKVPGLTQYLPTSQAWHRQVCGRLSFSFPFCPIFLDLAPRSHIPTQHHLCCRQPSLSLPSYIPLFFFSRISISHCVKPSERRKRKPTQVFLPGELHGQRSLAGYSPRGRKESDTTKSSEMILSFAVNCGIEECVSLLVTNIRRERACGK